MRIKIKLNNNNIIITGLKLTYSDGFEIHKISHLFVILNTSLLPFIQADTSWKKIIEINFQVKLSKPISS